MDARGIFIKSLMLALLKFCIGNVIITSTFTTLKPLGYLQCASICLEYSACEEIYYSRIKLDCRLNYLNDGIINYFPSEFKKFIRVSRSTIRQLLSVDKDSTAAHECPKTKRRVMLKTKSFACIGFLPTNTSLNNTALKKYTRQRSTQFESSSDRAVDGNWDANWHRNSCSHTVPANGSHWWMVDLAQLYHIYEVRIQNRDDCCGDGLNNFRVRVGVKTRDMKMVGYYKGSASNGELIEFLFRSPVLGQHVKIEKGGPDPLVLCEVAVYALRVEEN